MNIIWHNYFDRIYCIQDSFHKERKQSIDSQLQRMGILDSNIFQYSIVYSNYLNTKFNTYIQTKFLKKNIDVSIFLSTYETLRDAYIKNYNKILIINDNIKFIDNENIIEQTIKNNSESDIVIFDKNINCYQLTRNAIEKLIKLMEEQPKNIKTYFKESKYTKAEDIAYQVTISPIEKTYSNLVKITEDQTIDCDAEVIPTTLNILYSITIPHFDKLFLSIYSLKKYTHKDSKLNFFIVIDDDEVTKYEKQLNKLKDERTTFKVVSGLDIIKMINVHFNHFHTFMSYIRLFAPVLFPDVDKFLYLDYDTFIGRKGIEYLYNLNIDDYYFIAAEDALTWCNGLFCFYESLFRESKIFSFFTKQYISSGVLLINNKKLIKDEKDKEIIEFLKGDPPNNFNNQEMYQVWVRMQSRKINPSLTTFQLCDQSVINWLFIDNKKFVSPIFNNLVGFMNNMCYEREICTKWGFEDINDLFNKTIVFHFNGLKPWMIVPENEFRLNQFSRKSLQKYIDIKKEMEEVLK